MSLFPKKQYAGRILKIASPAIAGMSSQMVVSIIDTAMVGRLGDSSVALAAMGLPIFATWTLTSFFSSLGNGTHILVARRYGQGKFAEAGIVLNNSLLLSFIVGSIFGILGYLYAFEAIDVFSSDNRVSVLAGEYIRYRSIGIPFFLMAVSYRGFFYGIGHTKMFMFSAIVTYLLNIVFNYLLIFGKLGFPQMGIAGAGLASTVGMIGGFLYFVGVTFSPQYRRKYRYYDLPAIAKKYIDPIVRISLPVSFQNVLILVGFLVFVAITGVIGTIEQAATQVVITSLYVSFMPCFGFGIATQTLVGNALGNNNPGEAQQYGIETAKLGTLFTLSIGVLFVAFPDLVLQIITNNDDVINVGRPLLRIAGIAQIAYGSGIIIANALQAAGDTLFVMYLEIVTHWIIFLPVSYVLGVTMGNGIIGSWMALPIYITLYTAFAWVKFMSGSWKTLKV